MVVQHGLLDKKLFFLSDSNKYFLLNTDLKIIGNLPDVDKIQACHILIKFK
jgi:hypothetical protein